MATKNELIIVKALLKQFESANSALENAFKVFTWQDMVDNECEDVAYEILKRKGYSAHESLLMVTNRRHKTSKHGPR